MSDNQEIQIIEQEPKSLTVDQRTTLTAQDIINSVSLVKQVSDAVMKPGVHFGTIPGCGSKPTLLKPGAEMLAMTFRLAPKYEITMKEYANGHREYSITTILTHMVSGQLFGQGVGSCSTMESKYKNRPVADVYNTVLKMAKKRSFVDAVLNATSASDMFTQDVEDIKENEEVYHVDTGHKQDTVNVINKPVYSNSSYNSEDYPMPFGKEKGQKISSIGDKNLRGAIQWSKDKNKFGEFVKIAEEYLASKTQPTHKPIDDLEAIDIPF
jgi:hypothetical protein